MSISLIDYLTADFYKGISFQNGEPPDFISVKILFYGSGILINNTFDKPITFTAESFIQTLEARVASGEMQQLMQHEINSKTDVFGKVAQRISVYEYNLADHKIKNLPRGINYIQYVQVEDSWRIISMLWHDENELYQIPRKYLSFSK